MNIIDYVRSNFDRFNERALTEVDSLVLSQLSYLNVPEDLKGRDDVCIKDLYRAEDFDAIVAHTVMPEKNLELLAAVAASPRFRELRILSPEEDFDERIEMQFAASVYDLGDGCEYLAFRGTDSSLIGWKEDFNMAFSDEVPAQEKAKNYINSSCLSAKQLYVGGHSKGGNLAIYASALCDAAIRDKIVHVFSHDGPGFHEPFLQTEGYKGICPLIQKTVPESSIVGILLKEDHGYTVVKSDAVSIMQHDAFTWLIEGLEFKKAENLSVSSRYLDETISAWLEKISDEERERFVNTLFELLTASDAKHFGEDWKAQITASIEVAKNLTPDTRGFLLKTVDSLKNTAIEVLTGKTNSEKTEEEKQLPL